MGKVTVIIESKDFTSTELENTLRALFEFTFWEGGKEPEIYVVPNEE